MDEIKQLYNLVEHCRRKRRKDVEPLLKAIEALENVKQGGVSDDVCQWMIFDNSIEDDDHIWTYETGCKNYIEEEHTLHFDYCPYCGKKIKVVE